MGTKLRNKQKGFTIIEVTIVLAIAGVIMAIVFLAVPALRRNAANTQRRSDASHLAGLVNDYAANFSGSLPTCIKGTGCANGLDVSGETFSKLSPPAAGSTIGTTAAYGSTSSMVVVDSATCDSTSGTITAGANNNSFAIGFKVETSNGTLNDCVGE